MHFTQPSLLSSHTLTSLPKVVRMVAEPAHKLVRLPLPGHGRPHLAVDAGGLVQDGPQLRLPLALDPAVVELDRPPSARARPVVFSFSFSFSFSLFFKFCPLTLARCLGHDDALLEPAPVPAHEVDHEDVEEVEHADADVEVEAVQDGATGVVAVVVLLLLLSVSRRCVGPEEAVKGRPQRLDAEQVEVGPAAVAAHRDRLALLLGPAGVAAVAPRGGAARHQVPLAAGFDAELAAARVGVYVVYQLAHG